MKKAISFSIFVMIVLLILISKEFASAQTMKEPASNARAATFKRVTIFKKVFTQRIAWLQIAGAPYGRRRTWY
jgi:hypothetical protein